VEQLNLLGITGHARSGKGTIAAHLVAQGWVEHSFGAPLRTFIAEELLGIGLAEFDAVKEIPQAKLGGKTPRFAMQTLGTEWGREMVWTNLWVEKCMAKVLKELAAGQRVVLSDVRLDNEALAILNAGGRIIRVHRPGVTIAGSAHSSERGIDPAYIYAELYNRGTRERLVANVDSVLGAFERMRA